MILQTIHKRVSNLSFMAFLAMLMTFVTFESQARTIKVMSYSGEALFKGIFFAEGEVAEQIPELSGLSAKNFASTDEERHEIDAFQAEVIAYVNKNHPGYMGALESAVNARSHVKINQVITQGKSIVEAAVNSLSYERDLKVEQQFQANLEAKVNEDMSVEEVKEVLRAEINTTSKALGAQACIAVIILVVLALAIVLVIPFAVSDSDFYYESMVDSITKL